MTCGDADVVLLARELLRMSARKLSGDCQPIAVCPHDREKPNTNPLHRWLERKEQNGCSLVKVPKRGGNSSNRIMATVMTILFAILGETGYADRDSANEKPS